jgi:hypothetical protein
VAAVGATVTAIARYPFHLDVFTIGIDNGVYSCWWDDRSGWSAGSSSAWSLSRGDQERRPFGARQ